MMAKGSYARIILATADLDGTFERLQASGAEVVQEPTEQPYGVRDCAFRDPAGNLIRINEVHEGALERVERRAGDLEQRVDHEVGQPEGGMIALALLGHGDARHGRRLGRQHAGRRVLPDQAAPGRRAQLRRRR